MGQQYLVLDYETRSLADLPTTGAWEYSAHESTTVLCVAWRLGTRETLPTAETKVWRPDVPSPYGELVRALCDPSVVIVAHNALFEQFITKNVLSRSIHKPELKSIPISRWICTASLSAALALPRKLEGVGAALGLPVQKDKEGKALIRKHCVPQKITKKITNIWNNDPEGLAKLAEYCKRDVDVEVDLFLKLPPLTPTERRVWELDQKMNTRGVYVDRDLVKSVLGMVQIEAGNLQIEAQELSLGVLFNATQRDAVLEWLRSEGLNLPNLQAKTISDALASGLALDAAKRMLEIRQAVSKTSIGKYHAFEQRTRYDSRLRDLIVYHGASTGRFTSTGVQIHNLAKAAFKNTDDACETLLTGDLEWVRLLHGDPMTAFSSCLRGCLRATPGRRLYAGDYSAIEARLVLWFAKHGTGLELFRSGKDAYKEMASKIYSKNVEDVTKPEREVGKRAVLGCLAEGTRVLTPDGYKPIEAVAKTDKIWSGTKWENHGGVVAHGLKGVMRIEPLNLELTPDHWILSLNGWRTAVEMDSHADTSRRRSGQTTAGLLLFNPSLNTARNVVSWCAAYAELKKKFELINSGVEKECFASVVLSLWPDKAGDGPETLISLLTQNLENVGRYVSSISGKGVPTPAIKTSNGTAVVAFALPSHPLEHFWNTLLRCAGLINGESHWTEVITTGVMNPETYESLAKKKITKTVEVFDLADVGPGNCFQAEKSIVHNCGYGMGATKFQATCKQFGMEISEDLAKRAVSTYREINSPVVTLWSNLERAAIAAVREPKKRFKINRTTWFVQDNFLFCELPSGRRLAFYGPSVKFGTTPWGDKRPVLHHWDVHPKTRKWVEVGTYGGRLVENVNQGGARDIMVENMLAVEAAGYQILITVHDEIVAEHENGSLPEFLKLMSGIPAWAVGAPVNVDGFEGIRYRK